MDFTLFVLIFSIILRSKVKTSSEVLINSELIRGGLGPGKTVFNLKDIIEPGFPQFKCHSVGQRVKIFSELI